MPSFYIWLMTLTVSAYDALIDDILYINKATKEINTTVIEQLNTYLKLYVIEVKKPPKSKKYQSMPCYINTDAPTTKILRDELIKGMKVIMDDIDLMISPKSRTDRNKRATDEVVIEFKYFEGRPTEEVHVISNKPKYNIPLRDSPVFSTTTNIAPKRIQNKTYNYQYTELDDDHTQVVKNVKVYKYTNPYKPTMDIYKSYKPIIPVIKTCPHTEAKEKYTKAINSIHIVLRPTIVNYTEFNTIILKNTDPINQIPINELIAPRVNSKCKCDNAIPYTHTETDTSHCLNCGGKCM